MDQLFQKPAFKALPVFTIILMLMMDPLAKNSLMPSWLIISAFVLIALLNLAVLVSNYRVKKEGSGTKLLIVAIMICLVAGIYAYYLSAR